MNPRKLGVRLGDRMEGEKEKREEQRPTRQRLEKWLIHRADPGLSAEVSRHK